MASLTLKQIAGPVADVLVADLEANQPAVLAEIAKLEGGLEGYVAAGLKALFSGHGGLLGALESSVDASLEKQAAALVQQYGPAIVYAFLDQEAHAIATSLGG